MKGVKVGDLVIHQRKLMEVEAISAVGEATIREPGTNNWYPVAISELEPVPAKKSDGGKAKSDSDSDKANSDSAKSEASEAAQAQGAATPKKGKG